MSKGMKTLLMGIIAVIVVAILIAAYFATQPKVKWWTPEKVMEKPDVDFDGLNDTILFNRVNRSLEDLHIEGGNISVVNGYCVGSVLSFLILAHWLEISPHMQNA